MKGTQTGRNEVGHTRRWLIAALLVVAAFVAVPGIASADSGSGTPTLSTDQLSYSPGGVVDLSGAGFVAGDSVTVTLADSITGATLASADVTAAGDGTFTGVDVTLPSEFSSSLTATATDAATGDTANVSIMETPSAPSFTPTITTDQQDYAPGSVVTITGSGWPAGDSVSVFTNDAIGNSWSETDHVTTDANGDFTDKVTLPLMFVANYTVNASDAGGLSATTSFTDGNVQTATVDVRNSPAPCTVSNTVFNIGGTVCAHSTIGTVTGQGNGNIFVQWINANGTKVGSAVTHAGNTGDSFDDTLSLPAGSPTGTWTVEVCTNSQCNNSVIASQTFTVGLATTTTVTSNLNPSTYGSSVIFTATVGASTNPGTHGTVTFKDGTTAICSNVALNASSQATCSTATLTASGSPHSITAVYGGATSGGTTWNGSTSSALSQVVNQKALTVNGITASDKVYDGNTSATINTSAAQLVGVVSGDTVTLNKAGATGAFPTKAVGSGKTVQISGLTISGASAGNYTLTQPATTASITAKGLTISGAVANNKQYDATTGATVNFGSASLVGVVGGDTVTLDTSSYSASFGNKTVGNNKPVTVTGVTLGGSDAGNYTVAQPTGLTANITAKNLTVGGAAANDKQYDATTTATVNFGSASLVGVLSGDTVSLDTSTYSAHFADKNVGTGKAVTVTGVGLGGSDSANYTVSQPAGLTANITKAPLDISAVSDSKTYDGTTSSTLTPTLGLNQLQGTDTVTGRTQAFQSKDVLGADNSTLVVSAYTVNDGNSGGNYDVTTHNASGTITPLGLTISGAVAQDKTYDGNADATVDFSHAQLVTPISGDHVSIDSSGYAAHFGDKNVGMNKAVTVTGVTLGGSDAGDYTVSQPTGLTANIGAKNLTISGAVANDKTYDGNTNATVDFSLAQLVTPISGDHVSIDSSGYAAHFGDRHVGTNKGVTVTGVALSGSDSGNYTVSQPSGLTANISAKNLTIAGAKANDKTYDSTDAATIDWTGAHLVGVVGADVVSIDHSGYDAHFADKNVGTAKPVTVTGVGLSGSDSGDYTVSQPTGLTGDITKATLDIYAVTDSKTYDGTTTSTGTPTVSGLQGTTDSVDGLTQAFQSKDVLGTDGSTLVVTGYTVHDGNNGGNYDVHTHTATGTISAKNLTISGAVANDKTYDANDTATINWTNAQLNGVETGDTVTIDHSLYAAHFDNKNVGTNKPVTVSGVALGGSDAGDYSVSQPTGLTASISQARLDIYAVTDSKTYDGNTTSTGTPTVSGLLGSDSADGLSQVFESKDVLGAGNSLLDVDTYTIHDGNNGGNYDVHTHTAAGTISPKNLAIDGAKANDKTYDSTDAATIDWTNAGLIGVVSGDDVSIDHSGYAAHFDNKNVGTGKPVTVTGVTLGGSDAGDYTVSQPSDRTASISKATLDIYAVSDSKTYDGNTTSTGTPTVSGLQGTTDFVDGLTQAFQSKDVLGTDGSTLVVTGYVVHDGNNGGNYDVHTHTATGTISAKNLTISGAVANDKQYDANDTATIDWTLASLNGIVGMDDVTIDHHAYDAHFADKNVGTNKAVTVTGVTLGGSDAGDYTVSQPTGLTASITKAPLDISAVTDGKTYDGTTTSAGTPTVGLGQLQGTDSVTGLSQSFASKDVKGAGGSTLQVDAGYTIHDGNSGGNYDVHTHTATGTISPKNLTISGAVANDKTYDANDTATINWTNAQLNGVVTGDTVSIDHSAYAAHFADKNVGTNKPVTVTGVGLTGSDSGDYTVSQPSGLTASISKAPLDISAVSDSKTYDGTTTSTGTPTLGTGQLQGTDSVTGLSQSFTSKDVKGAGGSTLQVDAGYTIHDGNNGGNYNVTTHTATGTITKASLDIYAVTDSKIYDGTTASSGIPTVTGLQGSDTVANKTQAFQSKNVLGAGNSTLVVSTYTVNDGNSGGNYNVTTHNASGTITARSITVTAQPDTKTYDATTSSSVMPKVTTGTIAAGDTGNFTQAFATKTAGSNKTLTPSGSVSDTNSGHNYAVTFTNNTNGVITPAPLTVTGITANNKVWDGTTAASLNTGGASLVGVLSNDVVTLNTGGATGTFSTSSVGTWPVSVSGLTITGNDSGNYMLTQPSTTASISAWTAAGKGFYAPVGVANSIFTAAPAGPPTIFNSGYVWNTVKGGQTVPLKFNVFAGSVEKTGADAFTNIATAFQAAKMTSCTIAADTDPVDYTITATGSTTLRYDPTGMQWIYNWQTPKVSATTCYRTYVTFADGSSLEAFFQLGK